MKSADFDGPRIRAACGEEHLLDDISGDEQLRAQYQVIRKIAHQSPNVTARIDDFVSDAELLANSWASEER